MLDNLTDIVIIIVAVIFFSKQGHLKSSKFIFKSESSPNSDFYIHFNYFISQKISHTAVVGK